MSSGKDKRVRSSPDSLASPFADVASAEGLRLRRRQPAFDVASAARQSGHDRRPSVRARGEFGDGLADLALPAVFKIPTFSSLVWDRPRTSLRSTTSAVPPARRRSSPSATTSPRTVRPPAPLLRPTWDATSAARSAIPSLRSLTTRRASSESAQRKILRLRASRLTSLFIRQAVGPPQRSHCADLVEPQASGPPGRRAVQGRLDRLQEPERVVHDGDVAFYSHRHPWLSSSC